MGSMGVPAAVNAGGVISNPWLVSGTSWQQSVAPPTFSRGLEGECPEGIPDLIVRLIRSEGKLLNSLSKHRMRRDLVINVDVSALKFLEFKPGKERTACTILIVSLFEA